MQQQPNKWRLFVLFLIPVGFHILAITHQTESEASTEYKGFIVVDVIIII